MDISKMKRPAKAKKVNPIASKVAVKKVGAIATPKMTTAKKVAKMMNKMGKKGC